MRDKVTQIENLFQAVFVGFFGPIGVSAIFYLMVGTEFLGKLVSDEKGMAREDIQYLQEAMRVVVWFLVVSSVVVHGLALPLVKVCCQIPLRSNLALARSSFSNGEDTAAPSDSTRRRLQDYFVFNFSSKESQTRVWPRRDGYGTMEEG